MAKAKFPGKPPKTSQITRLRVSSSGPTSASDPSRLAAQRAAFGLKLYHQHFVDNQKDDEDFIGFEDMDGTYVPRFQAKTLRLSDEQCQASEERGRSEVIQSATLCVGGRDVASQFGRTVAQSVKVVAERMPPVNKSQTQSLSKVNGSCRDNEKVKKKHQDGVPILQKSLPPAKIVAPSRLDHLGKSSHDRMDPVRKKKDKPKEEPRLYCEPVVSSPQVPRVPVLIEHFEQEKLRMKREVERYTSIMATEKSEPPPVATVEKKKKHRRHRSPNNGTDDDKEMKLRGKIQQLLRSQWESRLQLVDPKPDPVIPPARVESRQSMKSSLSSASSSEEESLFCKRRKLNSNSSSSSSSARKSKIILRKARLQLNQRLLKQLRHPSRLQKLVEPETVQVLEPPKMIQPSSSSILRPAQLVFQSPSTQPTVNRPIVPRPSTLKEPAKPVKPQKPPPVKINNQVQRTGETTVNNPLGCAFVMEPVDSKRLPGTVVCGVCGAVRRYSFILQARKFGTFSCEPCRKFISRILLARVPVKCSSGTGQCIHPPVLRWNSSCPPEDKPSGGEAVMTQRCKACWLKLALTGFKMKEADHDDLRRLLPSSMQHSVPLAANRPDSLHWAPNRGQMIRMKSTSPPNIPQIPPSLLVPSEKVKSTSQKAEHYPGSRTREKPEEKPTGPRVKHVCRSALPAARIQPMEHSTDPSTSSKHLDGLCSCCSFPEVSSPLPMTSTTKISRSADRKNSLSSPAMPLTTSQGERFRVTCHDGSSRVGLMTPAARAWQQQEPGRAKSSSQGRTSVKSMQLRKGVIIPDLWERFDADRVWDQGFAICGSKNLSVPLPLCYLCGSAGKDELVSCSSCCEPFHPFCVADSAPLPNKNQSSCHHWSRSSPAQPEAIVRPSPEETKAWICYNCVTCQICQSSSGERTVCSTCTRAYHWSCLGPAHPSSHRKRRSKWSCFSCLPSQDRQCPLCSDSHTTDDKLKEKLECNCCGSWIHATCEGLSTEDFRLLCTLNEVDYICRLCSPDDKPWFTALRASAKSLYPRVLKGLLDTDCEPSSELDVIREKISRGDYLSCGEFCSDVRQVSVPSELIESVLSDVMPWTKMEQRVPAVPQKITMGVKMEYDAESDIRLCSLCHGRGEGPADKEGRLLYCGNDLWAHVNCALWSNEVFEEVDGALQHVLDALARSANSRCTHCGAKGATVNCATRGCSLSFHFPCAIQDQPEVKLLEGKRLVCRQHQKDPSNKNLAVHSTNFEVSRCVYVDLGTESKRIKANPPSDVRVIIGSLSIVALGQLKSDVSGGGPTLKPVSYESHRKFWSTKEPWKTVTYTLRTIYVPNVTEGKDAESNVTVSHEEEDVIMAESGLNLAELDTQDDRDLIHMVLEDANFEQELEGGPNSAVATSSPNPLRDSGFYSDGNSAGEMSPSPAEDHALEAWLADPEHAVIFLDSALLASLDMNDDTVTSPRAASSASEQEMRIAPGHYPQLPESNTPPKRNLRKRQLSYSQWKKMRLQTRRAKSTSRSRASRSTPGNLDWNGNEAETTSVDDIEWRRKKKTSILQLDGAADSSETDSERIIPPIKLEPTIGTGEEPVKCRRCRRSYRTLQSFNKHSETCVEILSSSSSGGSDDESEEENVAPSVQIKLEPMELDNPASCSIQIKQEPVEIPEAEPIEPIQVPIVNSSSRVSHQLPTTPAVTTKPTKIRQRRAIRPNLNGTAPRPLAARTANPGTKQDVPQPPAPASFQLTFQPQPPPPPQQPVLYVTRPELNPCGFFSQPAQLAPAQQHFIIMPPPSGAQPTIQQFAPAHQPGSSPMVQYLGAIPSNLLSSLGIFGLTTNYTLSPMPTIMQTLPWEQSVPNQQQIVVLNNPHQPPLISFNPPAYHVPTVEPVKPPQPPVAVILPPISKEPEAPPPAVQKEVAPLKESVGAAFDALVQSSCRTDDDDENSAATTEPSTETTPTEDTPCIDLEDPSEVRPPRPTYSYRSAAIIGGLGPNGTKKSSKKTSIASEPPVVQHLKVVAHPSCPDQPPRTFHLKAVTNELPEEQPETRVPSPVEEMTRSASSSSCGSTTIIPPSPLDFTTTDVTSSKIAEQQVCVSDVFATPPASSEPPILPSDVDGDVSPWPDVLVAETKQQTASPPVEQPKKKEAHILYELVSDDGFYAQSESLSTVWQKLLDAVQDARLAFNMEPLYNGCAKSVDERSLNLSGLHHHALINLLEQLPNADLCPDYTFQYRTHRDRESDEKITGSAYGCVRAAPFSGRVPYDMFSWLASQYRPRPQLAARVTTASSSADQTEGQQQSGRRATNFDLVPITVRFKNLRQTVKQSVGVYRSRIHGRGLFCKRDIESGEMVVEYAGQVIRSILCDKREKEYEAKGMGCYMFRVDEQTVVDATVHGNAARFINHSCEPNCYSRIVDIYGKKHIIIFASRRIQRGEELTYDYKFPLEGPERKIKCNCGSSRKCRKYMN